MAKTLLFKEAERLYRLGFAIHWLHPKSKRPVESGWTTGPRKEWSYLAETYFEGLNLGARMGEASKIGENYLACIDVDVKNPAAKNAALRVVFELIGADNYKSCPRVLSGSGNGSRHFYCVTKEPFKMLTIAKSDDFEVCVYSSGRQMVLPPSIHPDTNKLYTWSSHVKDASSLPLIGFKQPETEDKPKTEKAKGTVDAAKVDSDFVVHDIDLAWLPMSDKIREGILTGRGVDDRSAFLLPAATALVSAGLERDEILSVLTDPTTYLGKCAYDHAKTTSRKRAALWVWKYTLKKVMQERSAVEAFRDAPPVVQVEILDEAGSAAQKAEVESEKDWRSYLDRTEHGKYKNTLHNMKTILSNVCESPAIVGRNEFAANDYYLVNTPWRSKKGDAITDIDIVRIKFYCVEEFGIEFGDHTINTALMQIADINRYHPVRDWLKTLRWDGENRIDTWLKDYAGAVGPEPYLSDVSRKLLVAMVARVMNPGVKFDQIVILEGNQGTGKSTLLRKLAGDAWFSDAPLTIGDKDAILTMQSKWLIEVGELGALNKAEVEVFKSFISQQVDRIRAPYGKRIEEHPRQCVILGTTNSDEYLRDLTGNRRFWSVKTTGKINFHGITLVREQLFAEALAFYKLGEPLWLEDATAEAQAVTEQAQRMQSDEWLGPVRDIVNLETFPRDAFELREVAKKMDTLGAHRMSPTDVHRITRCLKLLGFERFQEGGGQRRKLWRVTAAFQGMTGEPRGTTSNHGSRFVDSTSKIERLGHLEPRNHDFL